MISEHTRQLLRNAAIKNKLGGNKYSNRRYYTNDELMSLYHLYENHSNKLQSLFKNKVFKTIALWKNDLVRYLDANSFRRFMILINQPICSGCNSKLTINNCVILSNKCSKFCIDCNNKQIWHTKEYLGDEILKEKGKKITKSKLEFYNTPAGDIVKKIIGEKNSASMISWFKTDAGIIQKEKSRIHNSNIMKEKIRKGEFTPKITNSWTHWDAKIELNGIIRKFRSSWEACFWLCNQYLSYETLRIPYEINGIEHTYIADFHDIKNNILYEIKPRSGFNDKIDKMTIIINYCMKNDIKFIWVNEDNIWNWIDETKFDDINIPQLNQLKGKKHGKISN